MLCCGRSVGRYWQGAEIHKKYPFTFDGPSFPYIKGFINVTKSISPLIHRIPFLPCLRPVLHLYIQILLKKFEFYNIPFFKSIEWLWNSEKKMNEKLNTSCCLFVFVYIEGYLSILLIGIHRSLLGDFSILSICWEWWCWCLYLVSQSELLKEILKEKAPGKTNMIIYCWPRALDSSDSTHNQMPFLFLKIDTVMLLVGIRSLFYFLLHHYYHYDFYYFCFEEQMVQKDTTDVECL